MGQFKVTRILLTFFLMIGLLLALWRAASQGGPVDDQDLKRYTIAQGSLRELLDRSGDLFSPTEKRTLRDGIQQLKLAFFMWSSGKSDPDTAQAVRSSCEPAMASIVSVLEASAEVERLWTSGRQPMLPRSIHRRWPFGRGLLLLRVGQPGPETDTVPELVYREVDLAETVSPVMHLGDARTIYAFLFLENATPGTNHVPLKLISGRNEIAELALTIEVPPPGNLKLSILDAETGTPTPAVVGLYAPDHQLAVPPQAVAFDDAGFSYRRGRIRPNQSSHYWPGSLDERQVFFVDGGFSLALPAGNYKLIVGKGFEYIPVVQTVQVGPAADSVRTVTLRRWINMPARGWFSGDGHVHYARSGEESNRRLMTWARAEDVHMINVMRMGDALKTYFEQYAYGKAGRKVFADYALIPGQEDPRSSYIGHTLQMNIQSPVRIPKQYYLFDVVFDEIHRQGGLTGYAHVYQPPKRGFWVREDMTMNVVRRKVDFAEISEFGDIDSRLYYEFLNLGFKLTATAGSDVPMGNTIGTSRVYAYIGKRFDVDAWFNAVKGGRTFVTNGPILELTVNGQLPGSEIQVKPGETLHIKAAAFGYGVLPRYLEVVAQGEVVKSAVGGKTISLELALPVRDSTWIAARCAGAHTSPIYIRVGDQSFWKLKAVPELIQIRLKQLHDIEELTKQAMAPGSEGGWDSVELCQARIPQLLEQVATAMAMYLDMSRKAKLVLQQVDKERSGGPGQ